MDIKSISRQTLLKIKDDLGHLYDQWLFEVNAGLRIVEPQGNGFRTYLDTERLAKASTMLQTRPELPEAQLELDFEKDVGDDHHSL